ncbi:hypothetical protein BpHYR1_009194 [Brachionus plicatilis]|uniref:Uncharacterized protein n=1 Tax=Brachionus plicatilis TaxID=10195 RepID=A0A3M7PE71_BRAPC|nr:hypothetical protein BpHYR1_009194 [Brachionus plicatilis]
MLIILKILPQAFQNPFLPKETKNCYLIFIANAIIDYKHLIEKFLNIKLDGGEVWSKKIKQIRKKS